MDLRRGLQLGLRSRAARRDQRRRSALRGLESLEQRRLLAASIDATPWESFDANRLLGDPQRFYLRASDYAAFELDRADLAEQISTIVSEANPEGMVELPRPDGGLERFTIVPSSVMAPELAAKYPEISTYRGWGVDDPGATLRLDVTPAGVHAQVLSPGGSYYVDPLLKFDDRYYASYGAGQNLPTSWRDGPLAAAIGETHLHDDHDHPEAAVTGAANFGTEVRVLRMAVSAVGDYTTFHGGTVAQGLAAVVTAVNRVTGIYERDVAIRFELVANNDQLIFTNAATDPFTDGDPVSLRFQNQATIDSTIGSANYDVGHVFATEGGGLSSLGVVGIDGVKAQAVSGISPPTGDEFYVDFFAHELGHQFGARHTWNGDSGACGPQQYSGASAFEPGSGSTIMGYAGICGNDNLQSRSDPFFHSLSIEQIRDHIENVVAGVGTSVPTGNTPPTVDAFRDYTIPARTPFALTAIGSDSEGDVLTYSWEQRDLGPQRDVNAADDGEGPLFRAWTPTETSTRVFPRLPDLLANTTATGETLPTTTRDLNFRVTARDNRAGGGGIATDDMMLHVVDTGAAFELTSFNQPAVVAARSLRTLTWNVAGTTGNGIDVAYVNVFASLDGGVTFSHPLAIGTANDGVEEIVIPDVTSDQLRFKVEAVDNVFFDISNADITIVGRIPGVVALPTAGSTDVSEGGNRDEYQIALNSNPNGPVVVRATAPPEIELSADGVTFGPTVDLTFTDSSPQTVFVSALDDLDVEGVERDFVTHAIVSTLDLASYPMVLRVNQLEVRTADDELALSERIEPLGGTASLSITDSFLSDSTSPQEFSLSLEAGQVISAVVEPSGPEVLTVEVVGVTDVFSGSAPGAAVTLPPVSMANSGSISLRVTGSDATSFQLTQYQNVVLETEIGDSTEASPLDLTNSFVEYGSGRFGALGAFALPASGGDLLIEQTNNPALLVDIAPTGTALNLGDEQESSIITTVGNALLPSGPVTIGNNGVIVAGGLVDVPFVNGALPSPFFGQALVPFWDDLAGGPGNVFWEQRQIDGVDALIVQWDDRPHFDFGGRVTFQVQVFASGPVLARYVYSDIEFGTSQGDGGASATIGYQVSSEEGGEFSRNTAALSNGDVLEIVQPVLLETDVFSVDLTGSVGRSIDVILEGRGLADFSEQTLELLSPDGTTVLASGTPTPLGAPAATNFDLAILDFPVPADGVYLIRATSNVEGDYSLLVTEDLTFDLEPNDQSTANLRELSTARSALGLLDAAQDPHDFYRVDLELGERLTVTTATPLVPLNNLDPALQIFAPDGSTLVEDSDSGPDGRNAAATLVANAAGVYFVRIAASAGSGEYLVTADVAANPALVVTELVPTSTGFRANFSDELDDTILNLYDTESDALGGPDLEFTGAVSGLVSGSMIVGSDRRSVEFVRTGGPLAPDSYTVRLSAGLGGFRTLDGMQLDGNGDGLAGDDFTSNFVLDPPSAARVISVPDFVRGPGQNVSVPADSNHGLPISISDGAGVRSLELTLSYDPTLLELTGAAVAAEAPEGSTTQLTIGAPGTAQISFASPTPLQAGAQTVVQLEASVPSVDPAIYGRTQVLDIHSVTIGDGGAVEFSSIDDDALHVASFFGDVSLNRRVNATDAVQLARIAALLDAGFGNSVLVDPVVVGDISRDGRVSAGDASLVAQFAAALPVVQIPPLPGAAAAGSALDRFTVAEREAAIDLFVADEQSVAELLEDLDDSGDAEGLSDGVFSTR